MAEQETPHSVPTTKLEDLRQRLAKGQPVVVDQDGRLHDPNDATAQRISPQSKTIVKQQRWFAPQWYTTNPARLVLEQQVMSQRFPRFQLRRDGVQLVWYGPLFSNTGRRYEVALYYPDDFPETPPKVYPINPPITAWKDRDKRVLQHQWSDGSMCLYYPQERSFDPNTTAATVMAVAAKWLFAYEQWLATDEWLGPSAPGH